MESSEEEAKKAMDTAKKKISKKDYVGAKEFIDKAQNLYPNLVGLEQVLMMINVFISASNEGGESDWYGILGVDPLANDETVKKQYKKLALLLHPDKNKFNGAEEAFKLVLEGYSLLYDKGKRIEYDMKRKPQKPPKPHETAFYNNPKPKPKPEPGYSSRQKKVGIFWTMCNECNTYCEYMRAKYLNRTLRCRNCGKNFVATEIIPEIIRGRPVIRSRHSNSKTTSDNDTSSSTSSSAEKVKRWFEPDSSSKRKKSNTFWTVCNRCKTYCQFARDKCLNKTVPCPNCYQDFVASEKR